MHAERAGLPRQSPRAPRMKTGTWNRLQSFGMPVASGQRGGTEERGRAVHFEIHERLEPRELGAIPQDAHGTAHEEVPRHAHIPMGDSSQGLGTDEVFGPYGLAVYQQRGRYVELFPRKKKCFRKKERKCVRERLVSREMIYFAGAAAEWGVMDGGGSMGLCMEAADVPRRR